MYDNFFFSNKKKFVNIRVTNYSNNMNNIIIFFNDKIFNNYNFLKIFNKYISNNCLFFMENKDLNLNFYEFMDNVTLKKNKIFKKDLMFKFWNVSDENDFLLFGIPRDFIELHYWNDYMFKQNVVLNKFRWESKNLFSLFDEWFSGVKVLNYDLLLKNDLINNSFDGGFILNRNDSLFMLFSLEILSKTVFFDLCSSFSKRYFVQTEFFNRLMFLREFKNFENWFFSVGIKQNYDIILKDNNWFSKRGLDINLLNWKKLDSKNNFFFIDKFLNFFNVASYMFLGSKDNFLEDMFQNWEVWYFFNVIMNPLLVGKGQNSLEYFNMLSNFNKKKDKLLNSFLNVVENFQRVLVIGGSNIFNLSLFVSNIFNFIYKMDYEVFDYIKYYLYMYRFFLYMYSYVFNENKINVFSTELIWKNYYKNNEVIFKLILYWKELLISALIDVYKILYELNNLEFYFINLNRNRKKEYNYNYSEFLKFYDIFLIYGNMFDMMYRFNFYNFKNIFEKYYYNLDFKSCKKEKIFFKFLLYYSVMCDNMFRKVFWNFNRYDLLNNLAFVDLMGLNVIKSLNLNSDNDFFFLNSLDVNRYLKSVLLYRRFIFYLIGEDFGDIYRYNDKYNVYLLDGVKYSQNLEYMVLDVIKNYFKMFEDYYLLSNQVKVRGKIDIILDDDLFNKYIEDFNLKKLINDLEVFKNVYGFYEFFIKSWLNKNNDDEHLFVNLKWGIDSLMDLLYLNFVNNYYKFNFYDYNFFFFFINKKSLYNIDIIINVLDYKIWKDLFYLGFFFKFNNLLETFSFFNIKDIRKKSIKIKEVDILFYFFFYKIIHDVEDLELYRFDFILDFKNYLSCRNKIVNKLIEDLVEKNNFYINYYKEKSIEIDKVSFFFRLKKKVNDYMWNKIKKVILVFYPFYLKFLFLSDNYGSWDIEIYEYIKKNDFSKNVILKTNMFKIYMEAFENKKVYKVWDKKKGKFKVIRCFAVNEKEFDIMVSKLIFFKIYNFFKNSFYSVIGWFKFFFFEFGLGFYNYNIINDKSLLKNYINDIYNRVYCVKNYIDFNNIVFFKSWDCIYMYLFYKVVLNREEKFLYFLNFYLFSNLKFFIYYNNYYNYLFSKYYKWLFLNERMYIYFVRAYDIERIFKFNTVKLYDLYSKYDIFFNRMSDSDYFKMKKENSFSFFEWFFKYKRSWIEFYFFKVKKDLIYSSVELVNFMNILNLVQEKNMVMYKENKRVLLPFIKDKKYLDFRFFNLFQYEVDYNINIFKNLNRKYFDKPVDLAVIDIILKIFYLFFYKKKIDFINWPNENSMFFFFVMASSFSEFMEDIFSIINFLMKNKILFNLFFLDWLDFYYGNEELLFFKLGDDVKRGIIDVVLEDWYKRKMKFLSWYNFSYYYMFLGDDEVFKHNLDLVWKGGSQVFFIRNLGNYMVFTKEEVDGIYKDFEEKSLKKLLDDFNVLWRKGDYDFDSIMLKKFGFNFLNFRYLFFFRFFLCVLIDLNRNFDFFYNLNNFFFLFYDYKYKELELNSLKCKMNNIFFFIFKNIKKLFFSDYYMKGNFLNCFFFYEDSDYEDLINCFYKIRFIDFFNFYDFIFLYKYVSYYFVYMYWGFFFFNKQQVNFPFSLFNFDSILNFKLFLSRMYLYLDYLDDVNLNYFYFIKKSFSYLFASIYLLGFMGYSCLSFYSLLNFYKIIYNLFYRINFFKNQDLNLFECFFNKMWLLNFNDENKFKLIDSFFIEVSEDVFKLVCNKKYLGLILNERFVFYYYMVSWLEDYNLNKIYDMFFESFNFNFFIFDYKLLENLKVVYKNLNLFELVYFYIFCKLHINDSFYIYKLYKVFYDFFYVDYYKLVFNDEVNLENFFLYNNLFLYNNCKGYDFYYNYFYKGDIYKRDRYDRLDSIKFFSVNEERGLFEKNSFSNLNLKKEKEFKSVWFWYKMDFWNFLDNEKILINSEKFFEFFDFKNKYFESFSEINFRSKKFLKNSKYNVLVLNKYDNFLLKKLKMDFEELRVLKIVAKLFRNIILCNKKDFSSFEIMEFRNYIKDFFNEFESSLIFTLLMDLNFMVNNFLDNDYLNFFKSMCNKEYNENVNKFNLNYWLKKKKYMILKKDNIDNIFIKFI